MKRATEVRQGVEYEHASMGRVRAVYVHPDPAYMVEVVSVDNPGRRGMVPRESLSEVRAAA